MPARKVKKGEQGQEGWKTADHQTGSPDTARNDSFDVSFDQEWFPISGANHGPIGKVSAKHMLGILITILPWPGLISKWRCSITI